MTDGAELGLGLQGNKAPADYVELGRLAEGFGFDVVTVFNDLGFQPALHPLLLIARSTERVRLGPACLNPYTLHPVEIAGQVAALDAASEGRAYLGLAKGAWLDSLGLEQRRPLTALREAAAIVRLLLRGDTTGFSGERFSLASGIGLHYDVLRPDPPLLIGTWGERTAAWAGEAADEVKIGGTANPLMVARVREWVERGGRAAGRGGRGAGIVVGAVTVVDEDGAAARARARAEVAMYLAVVAEHDPTVELPAALVAEIGRLADAGRHEAAGALIPDETLDRFAFSGTPAAVAAQAELLFAAGARRVEFGTPHGLTDRRGIELLGSRVLPHFR